MHTSPANRFLNEFGVTLAAEVSDQLARMLLAICLPVLHLFALIEESLVFVCTMTFFRIIVQHCKLYQPRCCLFLALQVYLTTAILSLPCPRAGRHGYPIILMSYKAIF